MIIRVAMPDTTVIKDATGHLFVFTDNTIRMSVHYAYIIVCVLLFVES